ncbi:MAG: acetylxylan esterase [Planctomycetaceae bacterium]|nr:acetylxylan esterase [Planctomycetaceae bacterium]
MHRAACFLIVCSVGYLFGLGSPLAAGDRLPSKNLLLFHNAQGEEQPVKTMTDWEQRRAEVVSGMLEVMGKLPGDEKRCSLDLQVEEETDCGSYVRRLITYASEPGSRVPAYLLIPKQVLENEKRVPAVLCLHPTDNTVGHKVVVGLGGRENRNYAEELAEQGYVTLAPSYPLLANYQPDVHALGWESGTLKAVWDNMRGLDLLESLPYVDSRNGFGAIGHSLGGHNAIYTAVLDSRVSVVVSSCGFDSFTDYYNGDPKNWVLERGWCQTRYMPRLADYQNRLDEIPFDFTELIGALAPRRVFVSAPQQDSNFQMASVQKIVVEADRIYALYNRTGYLQAVHPDCPHDFPDESRKQAYAVIAKTLVVP